MKNIAIVACVVFALATPAMAQSHFERSVQNLNDTVTSPLRQMGQNLCNNHRGTGDGMEASWCYGVVVNPMTGRVEGFNPNSVAGQRARGYRVKDYYRLGSYGFGYGDGYGYGNDVSSKTLGTVLGGVGGALLTQDSSNLAKAGAIVGGAVLGNIVGGKLDQRGNNGEFQKFQGEKPSDCVKRTLKEFSKRKILVPTYQVIAMCTGQSVQADNDRPTYTSPPPAPPAVQWEEPKEVEAPAHPISKRLCNRTSNPVIVYRDGVEIGQLAAGMYTRVAPGKIDVRSESCDLQALENGNDVNLSCR